MLRESDLKAGSLENEFHNIQPEKEKGATIWYLNGYPEMMN
jgi:hypothetical protein